MGRSYTVYDHPTRDEIDSKLLIGTALRDPAKTTRDHRVASFSHPDTTKEKELLQDLIDLEVDLDLVGYTSDDVSAVLDELDVDKFFEDEEELTQSEPGDGLGDENNEITCPH